MFIIFIFLILIYSSYIDYIHRNMFSGKFQSENKSLMVVDTSGPLSHCIYSSIPRIATIKRELDNLNKLASYPLTQNFWSITLIIPHFLHKNCEKVYSSTLFLCTWLQLVIFLVSPIPQGALGWKAKIGTWIFKCGSSLISERFVLTAGHCSRVPSTDTTVTELQPKIVRLGCKNIMDVVSVKTSSQPADFHCWIKAFPSTHHHSLSSASLIRSLPIIRFISSVQWAGGHPYTTFTFT